MQQGRAVVSLQNIRKNAAFFKRRAEGARLCAVVKADAYGHGACMVAAALRGVADCFAVALVSEGAALRLAGIGEEILVLTPALTEEEVLRGLHYGLSFTVGDRADLALLQKVCARCGVRARWHLKCNTGMNRYGVEEEELSALLSSLGGMPPEGVYSHFYRPEDAETRKEQFARFVRMADRAEACCGRLVRHLSATGGTLAGGFAQDMVRIGIGLYGYLPQGFSLPEGMLQPAMRVYAAVAAERTYRFGGAGYGERVPHGRLYTLRCGYADGLFRADGAYPLCMDAAVREGAAHKYAEIPVLTDAATYAERHGTIAYEVLVRAAARAEKVYEG